MTSFEELKMSCVQKKGVHPNGVGRRSPGWPNCGDLQAPSGGTRASRVRLRVLKLPSSAGQPLRGTSSKQVGLSQCQFLPAVGSSVLLDRRMNRLSLGFLTASLKASQRSPVAGDAWKPCCATLRLYLPYPSAPQVRGGDMLHSTSESTSQLTRNYSRWYLKETSRQIRTIIATIAGSNFLPMSC